MRRAFKKIFARFLAKVRIPTDPDGCHEWMASTSPAGYGYFRMDGETWLAHRARWALEHGQIPDGLCVLHHCDNPSCVRLNHLWLGTQADNNADMDAKGRRSINRPKNPCRSFGEANPAAKITDAEAEALRRDHAAALRYPSGRLRRGEMKALVSRYGLDASTIGKICRGATRPRSSGELRGRVR